MTTELTPRAAVQRCTPSASVDFPAPGPPTIATQYCSPTGRPTAFDMARSERSMYVDSMRLSTAAVAIPRRTKSHLCCVKCG
eukprot:CAMPEP_0171819204 /NCGR_PEP_ID=MMETSP0992-20121227/2076_1 /TAXON_ID=483369 /ORGANISM="non described non described, Strain CCMP2098" /LENGTH=81 /DNA_ID=CAMNT_0012433447 /DNA_START=695 /DNA_END=936 /DNA_ORIENTATION=+